MSIYKEHKKLGLCVQCNDKPIDGKVMCQKHLDKSRQKLISHREKLSSKGLCVCGKPLDSKRKNCRQCIKSTGKLREIWRANSLCISCGKERMEGFLCCEQCIKQYRSKGVSNRVKWKRQIFDHYGNCCACCGEKEIVFLTVDHINN